MSVHLIECASRVVGIPPSHKLLLLCFADDARDGNGRRASPGLEAAMRWSTLSRTRAFDALKNLEELVLLEQVERGHGTNRGRGKGHRAVYVVFPNGCCEAHGLEPSDSPAVRTLTTRSLSPAQVEQRRRNSQRIASRRAESGSDAQHPDEPVDSPAVRTLIRSQGPEEIQSGSGDSLSGSDRPDPSRTTPVTTSHEVAPSLHSPGPWSTSRTSTSTSSATNRVSS